MATIRRHPVPTDSFRPDGPLNDLGRKQLEHFIHVAERLPTDLRVDLPIPSPEDGRAAGNFIAAVTERLMSRKRAPLMVVGKRRRKQPSTSITLAAAADAEPRRRSSRKRKPSSDPPAKGSGA